MNEPDSHKNPFQAPETESTTAEVESPTGGSSIVVKLAIFAGIVLLAGGLFWTFGRYIQLDYLADRETDLRNFFQQNPVLTYSIAFILYVAVTALSLPGAAGMTLVYGWLFPLFPAIVLVSFASTTGATLAFMLSRYLFREAIQSRFGDQLAKFNQALEEEGAFYLFSLRLIPAVPFFVINAVMGLTPMRVSTFWWVSQVGMFAGTIVYLYAGNSIPSLQTIADKGASGIISINLLIAFILLGLFPLVVKKIFQAIKGKQVAN